MKLVSGLPETRCGAGSKLEGTVNVRKFLPQLLKQYSIDMLIDAPCGDMNWMAQTDLRHVLYLGIEKDPVNALTARNKNFKPSTFAPLTKTIVEGDVLAIEKLTRFYSIHKNLLLCRDYIQHIPNAAIEAFIECIKQAPIDWLLITCHDYASNIELDVHGIFRPVNLRKPPFNFPEPVHMIVEPAGRFLGLWNVNSLRKEQ